MPPQCFGINSVIFIFAIRGSRRQEMQAAAALGRLSGHDHDSTEKKITVKFLRAAAFVLNKRCFPRKQQLVLSPRLTLRPRRVTCT